MRQPLGRGVRAMRRGEGVVDVEVAQRREPARERAVVPLFLRMEPEILQECHVARLHGRDDALSFWTNAILRESDGLAAERSTERLDQRSEEHTSELQS